MKATLRRMPGYGRLRNIVRRIIDRPPPLPKWAPGGSPRVLFVNGSSGAPMAYRVLNQAEQLTLAGIAHTCYQDDDARLLRQIERCDALYLYRVRDSALMREAIASARAAGRPVVFDTDDLIWDQRLLDYCYIRERYPAREVQGFVDAFQQAEAMMRLADRFVASTPYLADALRAHFPQPVDVNPNAASRRFVRDSAQLFEQRRPKLPGDPIIIGYASGWPKAHEEDFAEALPAVLRALNALPNARLRIMGHFELDALPGLPKGRVETAPFVPWEQMPRLLAQLDINLAPIVDNPHRRSKSAVKFLEAALVGVPTVASDLEPYRGIRHGETGFLARDEASWYDAVMALAADPARCHSVGAAARAQVLADDTTERRAPAFARLLRAVTAAASASGRAQSVS